MSDLVPLGVLANIHLSSHPQRARDAITPLVGGLDPGADVETYRVRLPPAFLDHVAEQGGVPPSSTPEQVRSIDQRLYRFCRGSHAWDLWSMD